MPEHISTVTCLVETTDWQLVDLPPMDCAPTGRILSLAALGPAASTAALALIGAGLVLGLAMAASLFREAEALRARGAEAPSGGVGDPPPPPYGGRRGARMARFGRTRGRDAATRAEPRRAWSG